MLSMISVSGLTAMIIEPLEIVTVLADEPLYAFNADAFSPVETENETPPFLSGPVSRSQPANPASATPKIAALVKRESMPAIEHPVLEVGRNNGDVMRCVPCE